MAELAKSDTLIEGGIEWLGVPADSEDVAGQCARCGSSIGFRECWNCGGELYSHHNCGEDCCACRYPVPNVLCDVCKGAGGSWHCISTPTYCEANPLPGREHIRSTALKAEAWED